MLTLALSSILIVSLAASVSPVPVQSVAGKMGGLPTSLIGDRGGEQPVVPRAC